MNAIMIFLTGRVGRLLFAIPFGIFGILHIMMAGDMVGLVPDFIPGGIIWVYLTGIALLGACISFVIQKEIATVALLLASMLVIFALTVHLPNVLNGDPSAMPNLLKDISLAGAALIFAGKYSGLSDQESFS